MLIIILIVLGSVFGYCAMAGAVYRKSLARDKGQCTRCIADRATTEEDKIRYYYSPCSLDHEFSAGLRAVFWPLTLPFTLGAIGADREYRQANKRRLESEAAEHRIRIAEQEARAREIETAAIDRELAVLNHERRMKGLAEI